MQQSKNILFSALLVLCGVTNGQVISRYAGNYTSGYSGNGSSASAAQLSSPAGVYSDKMGNVYIAEFGNHVIRKVNASGVISTVAGNNTSGYSGDGGPATSAQLNHPTHVALDGAGNMYIADAFNHVIRKVNTSGIISTVAGNHTAGYTGDGGPAVSAQLNDPNGVWADAAGNIYIADAHNNVVRKVNTSGTISTIIGNGYNAGTTNGGYAGDGGPATAAELWYPESVTIDNAGNIYVAELFNNVVRKVNAAGIISTIAGNNMYGYSGDNGPATAAMLRGPYDVAINSAGTIFIADNGNNAIRSIDASGNIHTYAGGGAPGYSGDGGSPAAAKLNIPTGVTMDQYDNLYIADADNNAVRMVGLFPASVGSAAATTEAQLAIFPNPSNGTFHIRVSSNAAEEAHVIITNILGRIVKEFRVPVDQSVPVALGNAACIYFLSATTLQGTQNAKIIVK